MLESCKNKFKLFYYIGFESLFYNNIHKITNLHLLN